MMFNYPKGIVLDYSKFFQVNVFILNSYKIDAGI